MAPIFDYKALNATGKPQKGIIESENGKAARQKLKKQGLIVTEISERMGAKPGAAGGGGSSFSFGGSRVSSKEVAMATRQLASLVKANIPLVESLTAISDQATNERLKVVFSQVRQDVNEGSSLAKALRAHPKMFDTIFVNMVEAGESSGTLGLVLVKLADLKEAQMRLRGKIISGMTYPTLMLFVALAMMIAIFTFVLPQLTKVFESRNKPMPVTTQFLMSTSAIMVEYWYLIVASMVGAVFLFTRYIATQAGRRRWDTFKLRAPLFGNLFRAIAVTRFSSTMGTLLSSGVPILTAMNIAKNLVGNILIAQAIESARENITEGQSIAEPLKRSGEFPPMVIHMTAVGEKTGELPQMLQNVAETYEEQVNASIERMTSLLEPIMIVGMGIAVGFIVISVFIPLLDLSDISTG